MEKGDASKGVASEYASSDVQLKEKRDYIVKEVSQKLKRNAFSYALNKFYLKYYVSLFIISFSRYIPSTQLSFLSLSFF